MIIPIEWLEIDDDGIDALDTRAFYELMQSYRHQPIAPQIEVSERFEDVKSFIRGHFRDDKGE